MKKELLYIDCCIRGGQSRTRKLADAFFAALPEAYQVTRLELPELDLRPLSGAFFQEREALLQAGKLDDPRFDRARQLAAADAVVIAAPFWDLSFPALVKIYIENVSVEGITFCGTERGLEGRCRAEHCVFLTTRGGCYPPGSPMEQATPYLTALQRFFGFGDFTCVAADGLDVLGADTEAIMADACKKAADTAATL